MNSNLVLDKIITLLSLDKKAEVKMTYAELADGTVVESDTFDVGEAVEVVAEDGSKTPAPDGEHELFLKDEEGNEVRIRIIVKDGVIVERENVEELEDGEKKEEEAVEMEAETTEEVEMAEEEIVSETEEGEDEVTINLEDVAKTVEEMSYRIEELEKKLAEMQVDEEEVMEEEEELPKLDGAPVMASKVSQPKTNAAKIKDRQSAFLSKLYN